MSGTAGIDTLATVWTLLGLLVLPLTLWVTAPFGRHIRQRFGPCMNNRWGWLIMESPALWCFTPIFLYGATAQRPAAWLVWGIWTAHYINRGLIFPFRIRTTGKQIPIVIVASGFCFQLVNGFLNGMSLGPFGDVYAPSRLNQPVFVAGLLIAAIGIGVNISSDEILLRLRQPGDTSYRIPHGGLFRWVSCPNFLGEILLWAGWALMCRNMAALSFAVWTIANLVPRALAHHRWYRERFADYPQQRKAVLPGLL